MIYDRRGKIVWHIGRNVVGNSIYTGDGFCKSYALLSLEKFELFEKRKDEILVQGGKVYESALSNPVKAVMIRPINHQYLLYLDRTRKMTFSDFELYTIRSIMFLLNGMMARQVELEFDLADFAGKSDRVKLVRSLIKKYAPENEPVLVTGETGVGKNLVARLIHQASGRKGNLEVAHMPTIPEYLFESEIFGYKKGAFTDARSEKKGLVAEASEGTILLDEISEIPYHFQAKLLRFIETRSYRILGEAKEHTANVRVIAATNRNLEQAVARGQFREDLYYRLSSFEINIPPLRYRDQDIRHIVQKNKHLLKGKKIDPSTWSAMSEYHWPGNVRQLLSVVKRAGILLPGPINCQDIVALVKSGETNSIPHNAIVAAGRLLIRIKNGESFWTAIKEPFLSREIKREEVKWVINKTIAEYGPKYCDIIAPLNIPPHEYKKFLNFLKMHRIMDNNP